MFSFTVNPRNHCISATVMMVAKSFEINTSVGSKEYNGKGRKWLPGNKEAAGAA